MSKAPSGRRSGPRTAAQRRADVVRTLQERHADVWVASATATALPHLVPLSFAWTAERVMVVTPPDSPTARNIVRAGVARLAFGGTRDVVMLDARLDEATALSETSSELASAYAEQADWDPRSSTGDFLVLLLRPDRIQAWREADEIPGRTLMRDGVWLDSPERA